MTSQLDNRVRRSNSGASYSRIRRCIAVDWGAKLEVLVTGDHEPSGYLMDGWREGPSGVWHQQAGTQGAHFSWCHRLTEGGGHAVMLSLKASAKAGPVNVVIRSHFPANITCAIGLRFADPFVYFFLVTTGPPPCTSAPQTCADGSSPR